MGTAHVDEPIRHAQHIIGQGRDRAVFLLVLLDEARQFNEVQREFDVLSLISNVAVCQTRVSSDPRVDTSNSRLCAGYSRRVAVPLMMHPCAVMFPAASKRSTV